MATSNTRSPPPTTVTSYGPAGTPLDVRQSGQNILDHFCNGFPETEFHTIIPPYFGDNITELMEPKDNMTRKQEDSFCGRAINQVGEGHELVVFNTFVQFIRQTSSSPTLLVMRTFEMDTKNHMNLKKNALASLLPSINFKSVNTEAENDFVVLVQSLGVVFIEVKGSTKDTMMRSAEKQLKNVNGIVQSIVKAMTEDRRRIIPTVKLVIVPDCTEATPRDPSAAGSYHVYKDDCDNFSRKWEEVLKKLRELKQLNPFSDEEFKKLSQIMVGLWSATVVGGMDSGTRTYELKQEEAHVSNVKQIEKIDKTVDTSNIRNEDHFKLPQDKLNPYTKIVRTDDSDIFRSCNSLKLCYLTPAQSTLFKHQKQAIVRGSAGCGKSLLILFKVLEIFNDINDSSHILILAPVPHNIRIKNALSLNGIPVVTIETFPPPRCSSKVFLMELEMFFNIERHKLAEFDMAGYHIFIDDLQNMVFRSTNEFTTTFHDVANFIDQTYAMCLRHDTYFWVMLDIVQGGIYPGVYGRYSHDLFITREKGPLMYSIPIVKLFHVMRNTESIMKLTNETREKYINTGVNGRFCSMPAPSVGHKVTSRKPICHRLKEGLDKKHILSFTILRLREQLKVITKSPFSMPLSSVAIIYDFEVKFRQLRNDILAFLLDEFSTTPQTIEEKLINNNRNDIILNDMKHTMSFEAPIVIFICTAVTSSLAYYKIGTRARVLLTILDVSASINHETYKNMDMVLWKTDGDDNFTKYTCTCCFDIEHPCSC